MIRLEDLQIFQKTVEFGSFSAAARHLNITPALASTAIQRLERSLGIRLFVRSTRSIRLTVDGERYLPHCYSILAAVTDGEQALAHAQTDFRGTLRLSMPSDVGRNILQPWLDEFQAQYPKITLHLYLSDHAADLFRESFDASIRYGMLIDSNLVSLPIAPFNRRTLCASPGYIERHGLPRSPEELRDHNCLRNVLADHVHERWNFHLPTGISTVPVSGNRISNDGEIVRKWAIAGLGLAYKPRIDVLRDFKAGVLIEIFSPEFGEPAPLQLVIPHRQSITPPILLLRNFLQQRYEELIQCTKDQFLPSLEK